jgi:hypothetical protein
MGFTTYCLLPSGPARCAAFGTTGGGALRSHCGGTRCKGFSDFPASTPRRLRLPAQYGPHPRGFHARWVYPASAAAAAACGAAVSKICRKPPSCPARINCRFPGRGQKPVLSDTPGRSGAATRERTRHNRMYTFLLGLPRRTSGRCLDHWARAWWCGGPTHLPFCVECSCQKKSHRFSYTSGLTQVGNFSPHNPAITFAAAISAILARVAIEALAM